MIVIRYRKIPEKTLSRARFKRGTSRMKLQNIPRQPVRYYCGAVCRVSRSIRHSFLLLCTFFRSPVLPWIIICNIRCMTEEKHYVTANISVHTAFYWILCDLTQLMYDTCFHRHWNYGAIPNVRLHGMHR
jgi:hypothetical protein